MSQIKTNTTALQDILNAASNLPKPIDTSDATATSSKILSGYTAYVDDKIIAGNIPNKTGNDISVNGNTVNIPAGNYENDVSKSVGAVTQATPSISIDSAGKITATSTQTEGYVSAGTKSGTKQLTTQAAQTITPGTSDKTAVSSGVYTTGATVVKGDANLKAENILGGKSIFGVSGGIPNNGSVSQTIDGINTKSVTIPAGYTSGGTVGLDNSIDNAVTDALNALAEKGVAIPSGTTINELDTLISSITGMSEINGLKVYTGTVIPAVDDGLIYLTKSGDSIHSEVYAILNGNNNYRYYASVFLMSDYDVTNYETLYVTKNQHYHDGTRTYAISRARVQNNTITIDTSKDESGGNNMNISYFPRSGQTMPYTFCKSNYTFKAGKIYGWIIVGERSE